MSNKKNLGWLFDIGDEILPSYMGIIVNHLVVMPAELRWEWFLTDPTACEGRFPLG